MPLLLEEGYKSAPAISEANVCKRATNVAVRKHAVLLGYTTVRGCII